MENWPLKELEEIVQNEFMVSTWDTQGSDRLDFHDTSVASMKRAVLMAYELGASRNKTTVYTVMHYSYENSTYEVDTLHTSRATALLRAEELKAANPEDEATVDAMELWA